MTAPQDIVKAIGIVGSPSTALDLSPPTRALVSALDAGVGAALGLGGAVSDASTQVIASLAEEIVGSLGETITEIIGDVSEVIPYIGPIIKAVTSLISLGLSLGSGESSAQACARLFTTFKPTQTGSLLSGGPTVPADIFARAHGIERWYEDDPADFASMRKRLAPFWGVLPMPRTFLPVGPLDCRSALGMALMQVTEGCIADLRDFHWGDVSKVLQEIADDDHERKRLADKKTVRVHWQKALERDTRIASRQWAKRHPKEARRGLPRAWRDRFHHLRRGIEASWGPTLGAGAASDGGGALWVAYLDLLARAFDPATGFLTWEYVEFIFTRQGRFAGKGYPFRGPEAVAWHLAVEPILQKRSDKEYVDDDDLIAAPPTWIWGDDPCPRMVTTTLRGLVENWQHSVHPYYQQGQTKIAQLERDARELGRAVGAKRAERRVAGAARIGAGGVTAPGAAMLKLTLPSEAARDRRASGLVAEPGSGSALAFASLFGVTALIALLAPRPAPPPLLGGDI